VLSNSCSRRAASIGWPPARPISHATIFIAMTRRSCLWFAASAARFRKELRIW
jgi:hypothetical protein